MTALVVALALGLAIALGYGWRLRRQMAGRIHPGWVAVQSTQIAQQAAQIAQLKAVAAHYDAAVATLGDRLAWERAVRAAVGLPAAELAGGAPGLAAPRAPPPS